MTCCTAGAVPGRGEAMVSKAPSGLSVHGAGGLLESDRQLLKTQETLHGGRCWEGHREGCGHVYSVLWSVRG